MADPMTDHSKTTEERIAERREREEALRQQLRALDLDGPFDFPRSGFDSMSAIFGSVRDRFAICLRCGALVVLNDPEERPDAPPIERGVRLHTAWHEQETDRG